MTRTRPENLWRGYSDNPHVSGRPGNTRIKEYEQSKAKAREGSILLRDATLKAIMNYAEVIGTDVDTAASFLLSWTA